MIRYPGQELRLALTLLVCSVVGGYVGGTLAISGHPHSCPPSRDAHRAPSRESDRSQTFDPKLGPVFGRPAPLTPGCYTEGISPTQVVQRPVARPGHLGTTWTL